MQIFSDRPIGRRGVARGRRRLQILCAVSASVMATGWASSGWAQSTATSGSAASSSTNVAEVQVTAHKLEDTLPEKLSQTGVKVDVVPSEAIRNGGYIDIAESLNALAPSLYIQSKNGPFDYVDISLLGGRTEDVLWLVDGVRINNRLYAGTTPLDTLPAAVVDRIEVLEGGQALFYGTQAVSGAINIVTRSFTANPAAMATLGVDTNGGRHFDSYFSDTYGRNQVLVYGSADTSTGYSAFRQQDYQPSATDRRRAYQVYTLGGKYAYDLTDQLQFSASYQHTDAALDYALPYRVAREVNNRQEDLSTVKLDYEPTNKLSFFVKAYYHNWHTTYDTDYNDLAHPGTLDVLYHDAFWGYHDYGVNLLGKYDIAKGVEAYFGYDLQMYGGRDEVLVIQQQNETTQAGFGQLRLTPELIPNLTLAAGFRYNAPNVGQAATIWNVSGRYDLPMSLYLKGEVGTNFRLPTAEELFANDPEDERGNPKLLPEKSTSVNLTFGGRFSAASAMWNWEVTGFGRDIQNLIDYATFDATTGQDVFGNVAGTVQVRGAEGSVEAAFGSELSGKVSYTFNSSKPQGGTQIQRVPNSLGKVSLDYHPADLPVGLTLSANYTGDVYTPVRSSTLNYGNYAVFNIAGRYFLDSARRQKLNVSVENLFDRQYGRPSKGCLDVPTDGPYDCSAPYTYVNLGLPRTYRVTYSYTF
jgi:vitamin B12 transporter